MCHKLYKLLPDILNYTSLTFLTKQKLHMEAVSNHNIPPQLQGFTWTSEEAVFPGTCPSKINIT